MSAPDIWLRDPLFVQYAEYTDPNSDKFYEVRVDVGDDNVAYLTKRWGRRPDTKGGQSKVEEFGSQLVATERAREAMAEKNGKGYVNAAWPHGVAALPDFSNRQAVLSWLDS